MSQINSLSSFQYDDIDPTVGRYPDFTPGTPPITGPSSGLLLEQALPGTTRQLADTTQMRSIVTTEQFIPAPGSLHDVPTTQSLIAALQSTMEPATRTPVVIPGSRKRNQMQLGMERRVSPHLRLGIALGAIVVVMITTLISLSPLNSGQNSGTLLGGAIELVQAQQQSRDIAGHTFVTLAQANAVQTNSTKSNATKSNATQTNTAQNTSTPTSPATTPSMVLSTSSYVAIAQKDAIADGISPVYFVNQIQAESGFNANAVSPAGAVGIAQFEPGTAAGMGVNPYDPVSALAGAARLMSNYNSQYNGNYAMALAAYNAGPGNVQVAVIDGGNNWINFLPAETQHYIYEIMGV